MDNTETRYFNYERENNKLPHTCSRASRIISVITTAGFNTLRSRSIDEVPIGGRAIAKDKPY